MKALLFDTYGPPSALRLQDMPTPIAADGEVLVEVHASGINPSDVKTVAGAFESTLPRVPGRDYAGVVVTEGPWHGAEVWGSGNGFGVHRDGTHAEYIVVPSTWLAEKPGILTMAEAAASGIANIAAWAAIVDAADIQAGETVLVTGALGAVGRAAIQIARWKGAHVIGCDRTLGSSEAEHFIDLSTQQLAAAVMSITDGTGVDVALDAVGGPIFEPTLESVGYRGRHAVLSNVGNRSVSFNLTDFYHGEKRLIGVDTQKLSGQEISRIMAQLRSGFEQEYLKPSAVKTWSFDQAVEAYSAVEKGDTSAKHVLTMR